MTLNAKRPALLLAIVLGAGIALTAFPTAAQAYGSDVTCAQTEQRDIEAETDRLHQQLALEFRSAADAADTGNRAGYEAAIERLRQIRDYAREQREAETDANTALLWKEVEDHAAIELANASKLEVRED
ncbi:MAG: hypothetical protein AAFR88_12035 [Pseudomonadota bacterium]